MKYRVGMSPTFSDTKWEREGNPHLKFLEDSIKENGWDVIPISNNDLSDPRLLIEKKVDILYLHWPFALFNYEKYEKQFLRGKIHSYWAILNHLLAVTIPALSPLIEKVLNWYLYNPFLLKTIEKEACLDISFLVNGIKKIGIPVVWEQHDLYSHHYSKDLFMSKIDRFLHNELYITSDAIVVHEYSCLKPVFDWYGKEKKYAVAYLGPFNYGESKPKKQARQDINITSKGKIISYIGTARPNRNPNKSVQAFIQTAGPDDLMIIAGMGVGDYMPPDKDYRILTYDGFIDASKIRDIFCASDFVINDAEEYLTSAVIRTAMTYGIPVIAQPFGSTLDMAKDAVIFIKKQDLAGAIKTALSLKGKCYEHMTKAAFQRDAERQWSQNGFNLTKLFMQLINEKS